MNNSIKPILAIAITSALLAAAVYAQTPDQRPAMFTFPEHEIKGSVVMDTESAAVEELQATVAELRKDLEDRTSRLEERVEKLEGYLKNLGQRGVIDGPVVPLSEIMGMK